jgi:hypothetical protein
MMTVLDTDLLQQLTHLDPRPPDAETRQLDDDLSSAIRHTAALRRLFYAAVLTVAIYGTTTGAAAAFHLPWWITAAGSIALELGGVTFLSHADVRRRLGEPATASRLLGAGVAAAATTFNAVTHANALAGVFFALMSTLGFLSWWIDVENKRRDRLRARGLLPPPTPRYRLWMHWARNPALTAQARSLAAAHPQLGLYGSLEAARILRRRSRCDTALARALRTRIRAIVDDELTDVALLTYDLHEVARRIRTAADYDALTTLLTDDLTGQLLSRPHGSTEHGNDYHHPESAGPGTPASPAAPTQPASDQPGTPASPAPNHRSAIIDSDQVPRVTGIVLGTGSTKITSGDTSHDATRDIAAAPPMPSRPSTAPSPARKVQVAILGGPAIIDAHGHPVSGVRAKSQELLVYLAVNRAGATTADILAAVWPNVPADRAQQRLSTCLSNLRNAIRSVNNAAEPQPDPVLNTSGRYRLNDAVLTVDWWNHPDHHPDSRCAPPTAPAGLADVQSYPWLAAEAA